MGYCHNGCTDNGVPFFRKHLGFNHGEISAKISPRYFCDGGWF